MNHIKYLLWPPTTAAKLQRLVAVLGSVATVAAYAKGWLPAEWAVLVGSIGAGAYAFSRGLSKAKDGQAVKTWLRSTETWGVLLPLVADIVGAIAGVIPPGRAGLLAGVGPVLLTLSRRLHAIRIPKVEQETDDDSVITKPLTPKEKS